MSLSRKIRKIATVVKTVIRTTINGMPVVRKPRALQLPITSRCNSRCITCNVWKCTSKTDIDPDALAVALRDPFFSEITDVGVNGGELTLVPNVDRVLEAILTLPRVKHLWLISNCLLPDKLLDLLQRWKRRCRDANVQLGAMFSVDGLNELDCEIRGVPAAFDRVTRVLDAVNEDPRRYCDFPAIGCTISRKNAPYLVAIEEGLAKYNNLPIQFHLAVPNRRIGTFDSDDYSVMTDERSALLAAEFFYSRYLNDSLKRSVRLQMWANWFFLTHEVPRRVAACSWLRQNVTIDESLNFYLCATASESLGNLRESSATQLFRNHAREVRTAVKPYCQNCIHYVETLSLRGLWEFLKFKLRNR